MGLAGRLEDERPRGGDPVVLEVFPRSTDRVAVDRAHVVVRGKLGPGVDPQDVGEPPGSDVELAGLEPGAVDVGDPELLVVEVRVGDELVPASLRGVEPVVEVAERGDRHGLPNLVPGVWRWSPWPSPATT